MKKLTLPSIILFFLPSPCLDLPFFSSPPFLLKPDSIVLDIKTFETIIPSCFLSFTIPDRVPGRPAGSTGFHRANSQAGFCLYPDRSQAQVGRVPGQPAGPVRILKLCIQASWGYMRSGIYSKQSTKVFVQTQSFHRYIPTFYDIPLFNGDFFEEKIIRWLYELRMYFQLKKIPNYHKVVFARCKFIYGTKDWWYNILEDSVYVRKACNFITSN